MNLDEGAEKSLLTCSGCGIARYCKKQCQRDDWKSSAVDGPGGLNNLTGGHKFICALLKKWRQIHNKGNEDKEACTSDIATYLQHFKSRFQRANPHANFH